MQERIRATIKHGTILRNMWQPQYRSYFVYRYSNGTYAHGISLILTDYNEMELRWDAKYPKKDIMLDREHFPIVGHLNLVSLIKDAILSNVKE